MSTSPLNIDSFEEVLLDVAAERERQVEKWGYPHHTPLGWLAVIGEEFGEAAQCCAQLFVEPIRPGTKTIEDLRAELVQLATVTIAAIEDIDAGRGES